jgi:branched-chain amino acid transport system permease protein
MILAGIVMAFVGLFISNFIFIPMIKMSRTYSMIATQMFGLIILELIKILFTPITFQIRGFLSGTVKVLGATTTRANVWIIIAAAIVVTLLLLFMNKTKIGKAMRCVAEKRETAEYMGINTKANMGLTVALSCLICTIIGILIIPLFQVKLTMIGTIGMKGFAASIVGSYGSVPGAIVGGILVGVLENFAVIAMPAVFKDVTAFALVLIILMVRPQGIFGGSTARRLAKIAKREQGK